MKAKSYPWYKSIRFQLIIPLVITFIVVWGVLTLMITSETRNTADQILGELKSEILQRINSNLNDRLSQAIQLNEMHQQALNNGLFALEDLASLESYFSAVILPYEDVAMSYIGLPSGAFYGARRLEDNVIQVVRNNQSTSGNSEYYQIDSKGRATVLAQVFENFDPRKRPWYASALEAQDITFTPLYNHFVFKVPTVTASVPVRKEGDLIGVFGVDFLMTWLGDTLNDLSIGENGLVFIVSEDGKLVATSTQELVFNTVDNQVVNILAEASENPVIREALAVTFTQDAFSNLIVDGVRYGVSKDQLTLKNINWTVYTVLDRSDFLRSLDLGLWRMTLGFFVASLFFVLMVVRSNRQYAKPILALNQSASELARGEFSPVTISKHAPEMHQLIDSFNTMGSRIITNMETLKEEVQRQTANYEAAAIEAQSANIAKSRFLATMSHELRTPLSGIIGMVDLMHTTALTNEQKDYVNLAEHTAQHLLQLINDVLDYSKVEALQVTIEAIPFETADFKAVIQDLGRLFVNNPHLTFDLQVAEAIPKTLVGDQFRLKQVLTNLLGNAVKFTKSGGVSVAVEVLTMNEPHQELTLKFSVSDTGIGIPPDRLNLLFKPFSQVDASTTREYGGTGLGLAICKELVALMGGEIGVNSSIGEGSTFYFTCKLAYRSDNHAITDDGAIEGLSQKDNSPLRALSKDYTILVVEDSKENIDLLQRIQAKAQWTLLFAANGREGFEQYKRHYREIDVVLMDLEMPVWDGYQCTEQMRRFEAHEDLVPVPIIALSANVLKDEKERALAVGMNAFIQKPYRLEQLASALEDQIGTEKML